MEELRQQFLGYVFLLPMNMSGIQRYQGTLSMHPLFMWISNSPESSAGKEHLCVVPQYSEGISRARYGRQRTRFIQVPPHLNNNGGTNTLINSALAAGLYPKILSIDPSAGHLHTILNQQAVSFHPSSVNFRRRPRDLGVHHLSYFTLM